ncbi:MAG: hypothetical protein R3F48_06965 [Candidatus Zixiibacteriota bacterium]
MSSRIILACALLIVLGFSLMSCGKAEGSGALFDPIVPYNGDINLNGRRCEVSDAVMFTNYFLCGTDAFYDHVDSSTAASDVNCNGIPLELADLYYMIQVMVGDALPPYNLQPTRNQLVISAAIYSNRISLAYNCPEDIGAVYLRFLITGEFEIPSHPRFSVSSNRIGDTLHVLIINNGDEYLQSGRHDMLDFGCTGTAELIGAEASNTEGVNIPVVIRQF